MNQPAPEDAVAVVRREPPVDDLAARVAGTARELAETIDLAPIMVRGMDGTIRSWTSGVAELYGFTAAEALGRRSHDLLKTVFPMPLGDIDETLRREGRWRGELRHRHKLGHEVVVASVWSARRDAVGAIAAVIEVNNDVTEAREAERERLRLAAIVDSSDDAIVGKTLDGTVTSWNPAAERLLGYRAAEMIGRNVSVLAAPGYEEDIPRILARIHRGEVVDHYETRRRRKDGTILDVAVTVSPIRDASGAIVGASKIARDISDRKRSHAALGEAQARFQAIFEQAAVGIAQVALDGSWIAVNQRLCDLLDYTREALLTRSFQEVTYPDDLELDLGQVRQLLAGTGDRYQIEKRYVTRTGAVVWALLTVAIARDTANRPEYFVSVIEDISSRKRAERELQASEERFRTLLENSPPMMWVFRPDDSIDYCNAAWRTYVGQCAPLGPSWTDAIHPDDREAYRAKRALGEASQSPYGVELRLRRSDGAYRWHASQVAPLGTSGAVEAWVGTAADIDDIRRATAVLEERVAERTRRLAEANAELEAFAYSVAHDLRAPLRSMRGFSEALMEDYGERLDEAGRDYARRIVDAAGRLDELINDLLAYSRLTREEVRVTRVDLDDAVREVLDQLRLAVADSGARVTTATPLPPVIGQRSILHQVLLNLIGNAVKFVANGVVPDVRIDAARDGGVVRICVTDNGIGFDPKYADRVFKVFERLHGNGSAYPGTGIGLAIVRKGVERLGGRVGVTTTPGGGSTFWFELPAADR